jgi:hypothetical protein
MSSTSKYGLVLLFVLVIVSFSANYWYQQFLWRNEERPQSVAKSVHLDDARRRARSLFSGNWLEQFGQQTALFTIAVGEEPRQFAAHLLKSLAQNARVRAYAAIYVVTDQPLYFQADDFHERSDDNQNADSQQHQPALPIDIGLHLADVHFVDVDRLGFDLPLVKRPTINGKRMSERRANKLSIKWLKTQMFRFVFLFLCL